MAIKKQPIRVRPASPTGIGQQVKTMAKAATEKLGQQVRTMAQTLSGQGTMAQARKPTKNRRRGGY